MARGDKRGRSRGIGDLPKTHLALVELPSNLVFLAIKRKSDHEREYRIEATAMVMVRVGNRWGSGVGDVSKLRKLDPRALAAWGWDDLIWKRKNGWERRSPFDLGGLFDGSMRETPLARAQALGLVRSCQFDKCMAYWVLSYFVYPRTKHRYVCSKAEPGTKPMHQTVDPP